MDKIAMLSEILTMDPNNALARYSLAIERSNAGDTDAALAEFAALAAAHPDYTAGYFMAAQTLAKAGRNAEAATQLRTGIDSARRTNNTHAEREMQEMLDTL